MKCIFKNYVVLVCLFFSVMCFADEEHPSRQYWNLKEICSMESADYWTGPWPASDITVSDDSVEGNRSIEVNLSIMPDHHVRIEKNFVADCHDGFRNMMAMGMVDEDFSGYTSITFHYKTDIRNMKSLIFRVYDREGGWLQWDVPTQKKSKWQKVQLAIPSNCWPKFNLHRVGGFIWEIGAGTKQVKGKIWLDDLQLLSDCRTGLAGQVYRPELVDHKSGINPPPVKDQHQAEDIHILMNMTGEIGLAMAEHDADLAIQYLSDAVNVFKDVPGLEYFFAPEAWKFKKYPTDEEVQNGERPDPVAWQKKIDEVFITMSKWCEENKVPFYVGTGMSGDHYPVISPEALEICIETAPTYCLGALMGEFSSESNKGIDIVVDYMRVLKPHGLKLLYFNQGTYWFGIMMPHGNKFRKKILTPEFKDVFVPMGEYVVPAAQGVSFGTLIGMWQSGMVSDWGVSTQSWQYANMNWGGTSDQSGNIWLRMFMSVAAFGGRYIEIEPKWAFDGENVPGQMPHFKQWAHNLRWIGRRRPQIDIELDPSDPMRALQLFNRMARSKAIVAPADPEKLVSLSPAVFRAKHTKKWGTWNIFHRASDKRFYDECCPNYTEMSAQVPSHDAFSYLYRSNHFYDQIFPITDYGLVSILPVEAEKVKAETIFDTDGDKVYFRDKVLSAKDADNVIANAFKKATNSLPVTVNDCTWSAVEIGKGDYLVVLMDPEERFPTGVKTKLKLNMDGSWKAFDGLTSHEIGVKNNSIPLKIAPAGFRLVRLIRE